MCCAFLLISLNDVVCVTSIGDERVGWSETENRDRALYHWYAVPKKSEGLRRITAVPGFRFRPKKKIPREQHVCNGLLFFRAQTKYHRVWFLGGGAVSSERDASHLLSPTAATEVLLTQNHTQGHRGANLDVSIPLHDFINRRLNVSIFLSACDG